MRLLMEEPENDQYDSGADGILPECRSCRLHRPFDPVQTCVYRYDITENRGCCVMQQPQ